MEKLLIYLKSYIKESILGPLFKLLEASFELFVPLIIANIIDKGIANGDKEYIVKMCLLLIVLGIAGLCFSITAQYFAAKASVGFIKELKHALFVHIQGLSFTEIDTLGTSTVITRMTSDMNQVQSGVNLTLRLLLRSPFVVFGAMIMAFTIDSRSALIFAVTIPLLSIVVFGIMTVCIPLYKNVQAHLDKVLGITRENLAGSRVIRAFCKEDQEILEFEKRNKELTYTQKYVGKISVLMSPVTYIIINLAIIALIYTGAVRVEAGLITQGAVVALYNYMSQILIELIKLANLIISITKSVASGKRISSVFDICSSLKLKETVPKICKSLNVVEFHHVNLRYKNAGEDSLTDIDFVASKGEIIGIIGGTGSGKSSLINMIPRFYDASSGSVLIGGLDVKDYTLKDLRQKIGVVLQKTVLFKGTIRENILWGKKDATDDEIYEVLEIAQAKEIVERKDGGLDYVIGQGSKNLSGGQLQRLTIARALVKKPEILILDDATSALDFVTDAALRHSIRGMKYSPTVFIVSQRASSIQYADKIVVLDDGRIVGIGKHDDLINTCDVYSEIYHSQFRKEAE